MFFRRASLILAISGLTFSAAAGEFSAAPGRITGFGPGVSGDASLDANLGVLTKEVAWQNSPYSDVFQVAEAAIENQSFDNVADISNPTMALGVWASVRNDATLDRSNRMLSLVIAWQNSPAGDAYLVAQAPAMVSGADFDRIALASVPGDSQEF